ncbi:hypothetical protein [Micavibrio aeruginosavorus]|uniref:Uncharacterized domain protein n=1 Tax=Micavibrio aeruginosavorus (strain ARL-13) TaxID=856793 RepID=G2KQZ5_MICAA|nr:hypothetical protein [Micavibrio aeruginosavorus]AEP10473.1 putative uncharacterized domain protein [Micavibrio aeruginosavorus ARL-13]
MSHPPPYRPLIAGLFAVSGLFFTTALPAYAEPPTSALVSEDLIGEIRDFIDRDIVRLSILNQNQKYSDLDPAAITALDQQWVAELKADEKPLVAATLSNPLSTYLTRVQAHSSGLYTEIFVMDKNGLNVGQSNLSSDFWQGDEGKFQKTYPVGPTAVFVDDAEFNDGTMTWNAQVNLAIADESGSTAIGAVTVEVNLTELQRRMQARKDVKTADAEEPAPEPVVEPVAQPAAEPTAEATPAPETPAATPAPENNAQPAESTGE